MEKRLNSIYQHMKDRCYNKRSDCYKNYGGRGISICEEWLKNKTNFYEWALNNGYKNDLTIDRINNNGNYEPSNCRWITRKLQNRNHRRNKIITYNNETYCITDWAIKIGLKPNTLIYRIKRGWTIERALNTKRINKNGRI